MLPEQLLTAGTITELFIWRLLRRYGKEATATARYTAAVALDEEADTGILRLKLGRLRIGYFISDVKGLRKSHAKCTIVDDEVVVLGSGNMDRASWFTSQELGIAVGGREVVREVWERLEERLEGNVEKYFGW